MADLQNIVLIEDDRETAATLVGVLESAGYAVQHAINGIEGRQLVETHSPRLVITDMMMPRMGGFPVLEFLRTLDEPPRVIMITANEGGRHKAYAEMLGVHDYLRKPFTMDVLLDSVERALAEAASEEATSKEATSKEVAGKEVAGKEAAGEEAAGEEAAGEDSAGEDSAEPGSSDE